MRAACVILLLAAILDLRRVHQTADADRHSDERRHATTGRPRNLIALIFSDSTRRNAAPPPSNLGTSAACRWLRGYAKAMRQCVRRRGFAKVLQDTQRLAATECRNLFSFDRWDCTRPHGAMFKKVYRETSFMQAIAASALMFSVTRACSDGKLQSCYCLVRSKREDSKWHGVGCADNTKVARRITRRFLLQNGDRKSDGAKLKLKRDIFRNNVNVGLKAVERHKQDVCVCHGVSASCTLKTCWKIINRNFTAIAFSLKAEYYSAKHYGRNWTLESQRDGNNLIYFEQSPNFCNATTGRRCKDHNHCATLCCGRGAHEKSVVVSSHCNCKFVDNVVLRCETCQKDEVHFICK